MKKKTIKSCDYIVTACHSVYIIWIENEILDMLIQSTIWFIGNWEGSK